MGIDKGPFADYKALKGLVRREPLKHGQAPKRKTPLRKIGKRGQHGKWARREIRLAYFKAFAFQGVGPEDWVAPCQICGGPLEWNQADACHKLDASLGGKNVAENILVGHGLRCGAGNCNEWMETCQASKKESRKSLVNAITGGQVEWTFETQENLRRFLKRNGASWAREF